MRRRPLVCVVAGLMGAISLQASIDTDQPPQGSTFSSLALPDGAGKVLVERACTGCHDPSLVMFKREDEEGWAVVVRDMAARGAKATDEELDLIISYLAEHFSRTRGFTPLLTPGARAAAEAVTDEQRFAAGAEIYQVLCVACHQADGRGRDNVAPPLVGSELVLGPAGIPVRIMLHGKRGATNVMPALAPLMTDDQIAAALTYIRRAWGDTGSSIDTATVSAVRTQTTGRARPWTADELWQVVGDARGAAAQD